MSGFQSAEQTVPAERVFLCTPLPPSQPQCFPNFRYVFTEAVTACIASNCRNSFLSETIITLVGRKKKNKPQIFVLCLIFESCPSVLAGAEPDTCHGNAGVVLHHHRQCPKHLEGLQWDIHGEHSHTGWHPRVKERVSVVWEMRTASPTLPFSPG